MNNLSKAYHELLRENEALKQRIIELERSEADRTPAEERLGFSRQQLLLLIESSPDFFFLKDPDLRYQLINEANARFFGRRKADILGKSDMELMPGEAGAACRESDRQAIREKRIVVTVEPVGDRFYETYKFPVVMDGKIEGVGGIVRDITERTLALEELKKSKALLESVFNSTRDLILVVDKDLTVLMSNWKSPLYDGRTEFPPSSHCYEAFVKRDAPCEKCHALSVFNTGSPSVTEYYNPHTKLFKEVNAYPLFDDDNHVVMVVEHVRDITESKRAGDVLRESEEQFRAMFEMASIGVAQADPETGRWLRVNRKMSEITGYSSDEMLAMRVPEITHPEDRERDWEAFQGVVTGNSSSYRIEKRYIRKDGRVIWVNVNMTVIRDVTGKPLRTVATIEDITDRRHAEEQTRASLHEKEILLREIYHRVKNNLQVISSLLNMQSRYINDPEDAGYFNASMNRIRSMALVHDKLYRSESLASIYFPEYVSDLVRGLVAAYSPDKEIGLHIDIDPVSFNLDTAIPLGLIINELASNSLKHGLPEAVEGLITIRLRGEGANMTLIVSDNGVGFPRGLDFMNTASLGMQLVVTLVEQLDGAIELKRHPGTEFRITFEAG